MNLRTFYSLANDVYRVSMHTEQWSQLDEELMIKYGEPEIDLGGVFTGPPGFTLSSNLAKIKSESPFNQSFDKADYADAEDRADVWGDEIAARINSAVTTLRANTDDYTREETETI